MYARVTIAQVRPGEMDETVGLIPESLYQAFKERKGFKGALLLANKDAGKALGISLWETEADIPHIGDPTEDITVEDRARGLPNRRFFEASSEKRRAMIPLVGQPSRETYQVVLQI